MKAFFFDIDETLLDHVTWTIPESAQSAIRRLHENGHLVYLNSGRSGSEMGNVTPLITSLPLDGIILGDGIETFRHGERVHAAYLDSDAVAPFLTRLAEEKIVYRWQADTELHFAVAPDEATRQALAWLFGACPDVKPWQGQPLLRVVMYATAEQVTRLQGEFPTLRMSDQGHDVVNVTDPTVGKAAAMLNEAARCGIAQEDIVAFGDGLIDCEMLKAAGLGIALGNANAQTKYAADEVTEDLTQDGIYNACLRHGWIGE